MSMIINIIREYKENATIGKLYVNGVYVGNTLEDIPRPYGVKVYGDTCIPEGVYKVKLTFSNRFQRKMPIIYTEDEDYSINLGGITYTGVRIHGGNTAEDTLGCPLLGAHTNGEDKVWECRDVMLNLLKGLYMDCNEVHTLVISSKR